MLWAQKVLNFINRMEPDLLIDLTVFDQAGNVGQVEFFRVVPPPGKIVVTGRPKFDWNSLRSGAPGAVESGKVSVHTDLVRQSKTYIFSIFQFDFVYFQFYFKHKWAESDHAMQLINKTPFSQCRGQTWSWLIKLSKFTIVQLNYIEKSTLHWFLNTCDLPPFLLVHQRLGIA